MPEKRKRPAYWRVSRSNTGDRETSALRADWRVFRVPPHSVAALRGFGRGAAPARSREVRRAQPSGWSYRSSQDPFGRQARERFGFPDDLLPRFVDIATEPLIRDVDRSEEHTSELQSRQYLVCRLLLEKKKIEKAGTGDVET